LSIASFFLSFSLVPLIQLTQNSILYNKTIMMQQQQQNNYNYTHSPKPAQLAHLTSVRKPAYAQTQKFKSKSLPLPSSLLSSSPSDNHRHFINADQLHQVLSSNQYIRSTINLLQTIRPLPCWCSIPLALIRSDAPTGHSQDKDASTRRQGHCLVCRLYP
jgi:hypothetical protein